jgi:aminomethyltransferase
MAYVPVEAANEGAALEIDVRGRLVRAQIVPLPFYKRPKT